MAAKAVLLMLAGLAMFDQLPLVALGLILTRARRSTSHSMKPENLWQSGG